MSIEDKTKDVQQLVVNQLGVANGLTDNNLADGQVTPAKLSTGHPNWDSGGNATITKSLTVNGDTNHGSVEVNKAVTGEGNATVDFHSTNATNPDFDARLASYSGGELTLVNRRSDKPIVIANTNSSGNVSTRIKVLGNGNVGMGVDSPQERLHLNGSIRVTGGGTINGDDHTQGLLQLANSNDSATADHCLSLDPNEILCRQSLSIRVGRKKNADGTENTTSAGGANIHFQIKNPTGSSTNNKTLAIIRGDQYGGTFIVGRSDQYKWAGKTYFENDTTIDTVGNNNAVSVFRHAEAGDRIMQVFVVGDQAVGKIEHQQADADNNNTSQISLTRISDYRLKEDIVELDGAAEKVKALKPCNFAWKSGGRSDGFIAHELSEVCPEAVFGKKDAMRMEEYEVSPEVYEDGKLVQEAVMGTQEVEDHQGVDDTRLIPILTKALQEALAKIESLEARVDALENA